MIVITYWFLRKISLRGFLSRYKHSKDISLNWSSTLAVNYYLQKISSENEQANKKTN